MLLTNSSEDTFNLNADIEQDKSYEYIYEVRANKDEYDMYLSLNGLTKYETERVKVISQLPLTSTYVANIELLNGKLHYNFECQYRDVIAQGLHEPNELTNIFDVREYADNQLYIEMPKHEQTCALLRWNQYNYLIIRNDQYWIINGNYISIKDALSQCMTIIDSNELYSLLVVN